jgi:hypothetical protein
MKPWKQLTIVLCGLCLGLLAAGFVASGVMFAAAADGQMAVPFSPPPDQCVQTGGSIQAAIDAAADGGVVALETGDFSATLFISKSLTLSGGWSPDCATHFISTTTINAAGPGRVITVQALGDGVHIRLEQLLVSGGDASGLGGAAPLDAFSQGATGEPYGSAGTPPRPGSPGAAANASETLRQVYQRGLLPGGAADYAALLDRQERTSAIDQRWSPLKPALQQRPASPSAEVDCGGAIYLNNAALVMTDTVVGDSVASKTGAGYGGGLCAVNLPAEGVVLEVNSQVNGNIASLAGAGAGGAIYIDGADRGQVRLDKDTFMGWNVASLAGPGRGGALAVTKSPTVTLDGNNFESNLAGRPTITD